MERRSGAGASRGSLQLPQKRLPVRLTWPHAPQTVPSGLPHASQNVLVALFSLSQYRQSIQGPRYIWSLPPDRRGSHA
jgi:hypothetical protein